MAVLHLSLSFAIETKSYSLELRQIKINTSSSERTAYLAKKLRDISSFDLRERPSRAVILMSRDA